MDTVATIDYARYGLWIRFTMGTMDYGHDGLWTRWTMDHRCDGLWIRWATAMICHGHFAYDGLCTLRIRLTVGYGNVGQWTIDYGHDDLWAGTLNYGLWIR